MSIPDFHPLTSDPNSPALDSAGWTSTPGVQNRRSDTVAVQASTVRSLGIIGAGMMGTTIAAAHIRHGLRVVICDDDEAVLAGVHDAVKAALRNGTRSSHLETAQAWQWIQPTNDLAGLARCDLVLESIDETLSAKQQLYARLQPYLGPRTIMASNTSTIPIARLAMGMKEPSRFCGMHFFHPVDQRPLVEIVCGPRTSEHTIATATAHVRAIDRRPIVVEDGPGFVVNRLLFPYLAESLELLREGADAEDIEQATVEFGMALGPLRLMDQIGLDTTLKAGWVLAAAFPERIVASPLLVTMVKAGHLGCKSGVGFFAYDGGEDHMSPQVNLALAKWIGQWALPAQKHTPQSISNRLLLPMVLEAARILEEGKSLSPGDIDQGAVLGLGFPASRGGLLAWADALGAATILRRLQSLTGGGARYQPPAILVDLAQRGGTFHAIDRPNGRPRAGKTWRRPT